MAKRYRFERDYTHIVRDPKTGLVTGHVDYKAGHEGMVKDEHIEGAGAVNAGALSTGSEGARDADAPGGSHDFH